LKVLLVSSEDAASLNIRDRLLEEADWEPIGSFDGNEILKHGELLLLQKEGLHLYFENVDSEISRQLAKELPDIEFSTGDHPLDLLVFLSKHRSEMDIRSLTVHPPGNYLSADFGGTSGILPPSAPREMTWALKSLYKEKRALGIKDQTTYEVTHHGPLLSSPSFFIEIGSNESRWSIPELGKAIAKGLLSDRFLKPETSPPVAIGIGGGHYAPRFTDRAMRNKFAFGHMVPDYILLNTDDLEHVIELAHNSTPGAEYAFLHRSQKNEEVMEKVPKILDDIGLKVAN